MFLDDVILRRNLSFIGCILIIAATELSKILRSLFIAIQWREDVFRRQCRLIHTLYICVVLMEFSGHCIVPVLYYVLYHVSSFDISRHCRYEVVLLMCKIYGSTQKYFFTNAYVRCLLELSISFFHCFVNILTIDSLNKNMNLFVSPILCDSQV